MCSRTSAMVVASACPPAAEEDGGAVRLGRGGRRWIRACRGPGVRRRTSMIDRNFPPPPPGEGRGGGDGGGYYNYPVIRRPVWTWEIPVYFWLGGIAGGAYVTASLAQNFGSAEDRRYAADGFYLAALAVLPCAPLLTADLGRPERFHHMLRIFKPLSPMNLGAWTLTAFAPLTVARAVARAAETGLLRGSLLPLLLHRMAGRRQGRPLRILSGAAALCTIAGSLALRWTIFEAGRVSSEDQAASFELSSD